MSKLFICHYHYLVIAIIRTREKHTLAELSGYEKLGKGYQLFFITTKIPTDPEDTIGSNAKQLDDLLTEVMQYEENAKNALTSAQADE